MSSLRPVIVVLGNPAPEWAHDVVRRLDNCAVLIHGGPPHWGAESYAFTLYAKADRRVASRRSGTDALATRPVHGSQAWDPSGRAVQESSVVLDLTGRLTPADVPASTALWAYDHGDGVRALDGQIAFAHGFRNGNTSTMVSLLDRKFEAPIAQSRVRADPISLHRVRQTALGMAAPLAARALNSTASRVPVKEQRGGGDVAASTPRVVLRVAALLASRGLTRAFATEQWFVALRPASSGIPNASNLSGLRRVRTAPDVTLADPCVVDDGERSWLFAERTAVSRHAGEIVVGEIQADGSVSRLDVALRTGTHVSYPQVVTLAGRRHLLVESAQAGRLDHYVEEKFPLSWRRAESLLDDAVARDPTLIEHNGRLWLWVARPAQPGGAADELWLYSTPTPGGEWVSHPRNPIVSDVRRARPAGLPFSVDGRLIRPAQDCAKRYGHRVVFHEVVVLSETEYEERVVGTLDPSWGRRVVATHTFSRGARWEAVDGQRLRWRLLRRLSRN